MHGSPLESVVCLRCRIAFDAVAAELERDALQDQIGWQVARRQASAFLDFRLHHLLAQAPHVRRFDFAVNEPDPPFPGCRHRSAAGHGHLTELQVPQPGPGRPLTAEWVDSPHVCLLHRKPPGAMRGGDCGAPVLTRRFHKDPGNMRLRQQVRGQFKASRRGASTTLCSTTP